MSGFPPKSPGLRLEALESRDNPVTVAVADSYFVSLGRVLTVPVPTGVLANDFNDLQAGAVLNAQLVLGPRFVDQNGNNLNALGNPFPPLLTGSLTLNPNGSFTFIAPSQIPAGAANVEFFYQATNPGNGELAIGRVQINLQGDARRFIAAGADAGGGPHVRVYETGTSELVYNFFPYEATFTGGVRVALGDVNADGVDDIATIPQAGGASRLRVYNGVDGTPLIDQFIFEPEFRGGGYLAIGDTNGDGTDDIIVGAGEGGGPRVSVFTYDNLTGAVNNLSNFFAYAPENPTGVRVAAGDTTGAGRDALITAPGAGGAPQINVYNGASVGLAQQPAPSFSFFAGDATNASGTYVAAGNFRGDGLFDILTGTGAGSGVARVFDGRSGGLIREIAVGVDQVPTGGNTLSGPGTFNFQTPTNGTLLSPTLAPNSLVPATSGTGVTGIISGGIRVAATDFNDDGLDDIVTASGPGNTPRIRIFNILNEAEITSIVPFTTSFLGGVNVAATTGDD